MKNKVFVVGTFALAVVVFFLLKMKNPTSKLVSPAQISDVQENLDSGSSLSPELFVRPHSPRIGNSMARVVVVEWLDPECEACRAMHPFVKKIEEEYKDRVLFVTRYMPYHGGSHYAISILEEARELGKFEEALDIIFDKQPEWGSHKSPNPDLIPSYLTKIGIPKESLEKDRIIQKHQKTVEMDKDDGEKVGVRGTPSFFVNQKPLEKLGDSPLREAIEKALAEAE